MASLNAGKANGAEKFEVSKRRGWGITAILAMVGCGGTVLSGCAGLANTSNANPTPQATVQISPSDITFSNVAIGQKATQTAVLTNTGNESVTITQLASSAVQFATSGLTTPLALGPGQSARFQVLFTSSTSGSASGTLTAMTSHGGSSSRVKLKGAAAGSSQLSLSTTKLNFGNVLVNGSVTQAVALKNSGTNDVQITQIGVTGGAFSLSRVHDAAGHIRANHGWNSNRRNHDHQQRTERNRNSGVERKRSGGKLHHVSFAQQRELWQRKRRKHNDAKRTTLEYGKLERDGDASRRKRSGNFSRRLGSTSDACGFTERYAKCEVYSNYCRRDSWQRDSDE